MRTAGVCVIGSSERPRWPTLNSWEENKAKKKKNRVSNFGPLDVSNNSGLRTVRIGRFEQFEPICTIVSECKSATDSVRNRFELVAAVSKVERFGRRAPV